MSHTINVRLKQEAIDNAKRSSHEHNGTVEVGEKTDDHDLGEVFAVSITFPAKEDHDAWMMAALNGYATRTESADGPRSAWKTKF